MIFFEILVWNSICCWSPSNWVMKNQWHFATLQFIPFSGSHFPWPNCYLSAQPSLALTNTPSGDACALLGAWVWARTTFFFHPAKVLNRSLASKRALWLLSSLYSVPPSAGSGSTHTLQHLREWPPWPGEALVGHGSPELHSPSPLAQPPPGLPTVNGVPEPMMTSGPVPLRHFKFLRLTFSCHLQMIIAKLRVHWLPNSMVQLSQ